MTRLQYLINNGDILDLISSSHGVNKETKEIEACNVLRCHNCLFNGSCNCYTQMKDFLLQEIEYKSKDKNYTSNFMEKFNRLV